MGDGKRLAPLNRAWSITLGKIKGRKYNLNTPPNLVAHDFWEEEYVGAIESARKFGKLPNNHKKGNVIAESFASE